MAPTKTKRTQGQGVHPYAAPLISNAVVSATSNVTTQPTVGSSSLLPPVKGRRVNRKSGGKSVHGQYRASDPADVANVPGFSTGDPPPHVYAPGFANKGFAGPPAVKFGSMEKRGAANRSNHSKLQSPIALMQSRPPNVVANTNLGVQNSTVSYPLPSNSAQVYQSGAPSAVQRSMPVTRPSQHQFGWNLTPCRSRENVHQDIARPSYISTPLVSSSPDEPPLITPPPPSITSIPQRIGDLGIAEWQIPIGNAIVESCSPGNAPRIVGGSTEISHFEEFSEWINWGDFQ